MCYVRISLTALMLTVFGIHSGAGIALAETKTTPTSKNSRAQLENAIWSRIAVSPEFSESKRIALAESLHQLVNKGNANENDEGLLLAALAAVHSGSQETRYASAPFLASAKKKWPGILSSKEAEIIWKTAYQNLKRKTSIDETLLVQFALHLDGPVLRSTNPEGFVYYRGVGQFASQEYANALSNLVRVPLDSPDYRRAKYLEALSLVQLNRLNEAKEALQIMISLDVTHAESASNIPKKSVRRLRELGVLNLARILYEQGQFSESLTYYRTLMQDSNFFYESLNEQGWAFFMAGFPNRGLGSLQSVTSPFFKDRFNPDGYFLTATIHYWMCDFEGANTGILKFIAHTKGEGDLLKKKVAGLSMLSNDDSIVKYAKLLEDVRSGVSSGNLGLGARTVASLMTQEPLSDALLAVNEIVKTRVSLQEMPRYPAGKERILRAFTEFESTVRWNLGNQTRGQMQLMMQEFEKALSQIRLLHLEVLTAKKDKLLGKSRTVIGNEFVGEEQRFLEELAALPQTWSQDKNEFWYDELGFFVAQVKSKCAVSADPKK